MMSTSIVALIVVLGVLIFFHELGHFLVARFFGVGVERFSLGFGPRLVGRQVGRTDYRVSAIPLGGYVKMVGEEPDADLDPADIPFSFTHKPVAQRMAIVAAGPGFNILLALVIFYFVFLFAGMSVLLPTIGSVSEHSPAAAAGLRQGDRISAVDGTPVATWQEMAERIAASQGRPLTLRYRRGDAEGQVRITPEVRQTKNIFGEPVTRYVIGITAAGQVETRRVGPLQAAVTAASQTWAITEMTVLSVAKIISGTLSPKTLGGPIMIAEMAGQQAREGLVNLMFFTALISINLAILNILPIPVLDGGHLLFFAIEAVRGRPVSIRVREIAQQAGMFLLMLLMILVFYNDIVRIASN
jgi:regulator of sigma E protease